MMSKRKGMERLFDGRHFDREIIVLCVRWYLRYKLSLRDRVELMAERGLSLAHTTIMRWVRRFTPEFVKRWNQFAVPTGRSWRVDETYLKIRGKWVYLVVVQFCCVGLLLLSFWRPRADEQAERSRMVVQRAS